MPTHLETLDYLYSQLPMFHRIGAAAYKDNLDNTHRLDEMFEHPHHSFKTVHVAGTNGKGSVSHQLASILQQAGYKTGLYTSPHLKDFRERIRINGEMISEQAVVEFSSTFQEKNKSENISPSFFELTVAMAFNYFRAMGVDVAVVEVGLGGRLDSTNIISPEISVITNISFDHKALLGNTLQAIAAEKAGIIKKNTPVVVGESSAETNDVFERFAANANAPLMFADQDYHADYSMLTLDGKQSMNVHKGDNLLFPDLRIDLLGAYQRYNVQTVLKTVEVLNEKGWNINNDTLRRGLLNAARDTGLMGRWQIIGHNPMVICDTGHNTAGITQVIRQINQLAWKRLHFVIGMVNDKDQDEVLSLLPTHAIYYFTKASIPRATEPETLATKAAQFGLKGQCYNTVEQAFNAARNNAEANDLVFVGGSTFVVAEIL